MKPSFAWAVFCECGWSYPPRGRGTVAVKTDAEQQARAHRLHGCKHAAQQQLDEPS